MSNTRSSYWDNLKGVLIILVVFAHFLYDFTDALVIDMIVYLIYVFHMPAFVFVSGHFTHDPPKIRKLVTAFIIFQSFYLLCEFVQLGYIDLLAPAYICWYLVALIVWRLTARYIPRKLYTLPLLLLISLLAGFLPDIGNRFAVMRILTFMVFFAAGLFFTEEKAGKIRNFFAPFLGIFLLFIGIAGSLAANLFFGYSKNDVTMMQYSSLDMVSGRLVLIILAFVFIIGLIALIPGNKNFITILGRNSLPVFLIHRVLTFVYTWGINKLGITDYRIIIATSAVATAIVLAAFGNDAFASVFDRFLSSPDKKYREYRNLAEGVFAGFAAAVFIAVSIMDYMPAGDLSGNNLQNSSATDPIYRICSDSQAERLENSVRIVFAGDLILLEDQVRLAYDEETDSYDFSDLFEYTADEIRSADLAIGVYEGPSGGEELGYTTSNYGDGKYLRLNFPDEFASAVAQAGFDLVTTANNHLLDSGLDAAYRTNEVLDETGLMHIGTYTGEADRQQNRVQIVEVSGMRIAVLAYTFGTNYHTEDEFFEGGAYDSLTGVIVGTDSPYYEQSLQIVEDDFEYCRSLDPDLILVLPHMGTQFADDADELQTMWRQTFIDLGADIILGDHSHSVQPAFMEEVDGRMTFTAYCPGNYANIYREYNGDASALIEVFIDPDTHEITGGGLIPMWTTAQADGNYRPLPVWDIMTDESLRSLLTVDDLARVAEVHEHITGVVLGEPMRLDMIEPDYLFDENGFMRRSCDPLEITPQMEETAFYESVTQADSVCFIGDSITYGTKNGGVPWYEPLEDEITGTIANISYGGWTTQDVINNLHNLQPAEVYVLAIGTNDVRYDNADVGAVTAEDYVSNIAVIEDEIRQIAPNSTIWFIAPWISFDGDQVSPLPLEEVNSRRLQYSEALEQFCDAHGDHYIDPNPYIEDAVMHAPQTDYLLDWIHPNVRQGVALYSEAVIMSSGN